MTSIDYVPRSDPSGRSYSDGVITGANGRLSPRSGRGPSLHIDVTGANNRGQNGQVQSQQNRARDTRQEGAHSVLEDESSDNSEDAVAEGLRRRGSEDSIEMQEGEEDMDDSGSFSDSLSSSPSIPDEDIDFSLVYALHTFLATVDGQASVVKGDKLLLLDDSNSYWWLVRVLKTQAVGYIPAENIETPWERLARLNKHRNVDLTSATQHDVDSGPNSTAAQTRFDGRIPPSRQPHPHESQHPSAKGVLADHSHKDHPRNISPSRDRPERSVSRKAKMVIFTAPTYYEHSANGESDDEYDDQMEDGEQGLEGEQVFDDDDGEESDLSDENLEEQERDGTGAVGQTAAQARLSRQTASNQQHQYHDEGDDAGDEEEISGDRWEEEQIVRNGDATAGKVWEHQQNTQRAISPQQPFQQRSLSPQQQLHLQQQQQQRDEQLRRQQFNDQQYQMQEEQQMRQQQQRRTSQSSPRPPLEPVNSRGRDFSEDDFDPNGPTKKVSATPPIVRDPTFDMNDPFGDQALENAAPSNFTPSQRVRGVEVIDPKDPRYSNLISERRTREEYGGERRPSGGSDYVPETENSFNSIDTGSSGRRGSEDDSRSGTSPSPQGKKLSKRSGRESLDGESEKKKKGGGILSGLFRKKDKKKKENEGDLRSSEESSRMSPVSGGSLSKASDEVMDYGPRRVSQTAESMFSTDAALRQQEVEAQQALYRQYGVQRGPLDVTNTMTPRNNHSQNLSSSNNSFNNSNAGKRMRPGSLIGSPSVPGMEVPLLSVLRVFAGDHIESDATFKTVLLNHSTTNSDLVKQSMQRFRLAGLEDRDEYYLTVKELGGEERPILEHQLPLVIFEELSDTSSPGFALPSVKRSSIGSINSVSSNLSLNPAITRLGMNDWSDDSAVKFYLNRRIPDEPAHMFWNSPLASNSPQRGGQEFGGLNAEQAQTPSLRFAIRILIHPDDLPENVVFDPQSQAIIPRSVLAERQHRSDLTQSARPSSQPREKIIFFPRNVNVSEVVEAGLDRFGIVDGVVDGGDEVEDRVSRRRSISRVKYGLTAVQEGQEVALNSSGKILDAYQIPPLFKSYDRSTKEFRRRSVDATLILGLASDIQQSDPVFIIRRASQRSIISSPSHAPGPVAVAVDELALHQQRQRSLDIPRPEALRSNTAASNISGMSVYATPAEELSQDDLLRATSPSATRQEIIAAQRETSRANQRAVLSAQKNTEQGVDVVIPDRGTIRSSRSFANNKVRYSYIDPDGTEMDISDIVENEWAAPQPAEVRPSSSASERTSGEESFRSAPTSPASDEFLSDAQGRPSFGATDDGESEDERRAIAALQSTPIDVEHSVSPPIKSIRSGPSFTSRQQDSGDVLEDALGARETSSPRSNESLQDRLDRVLAKVREDKSRGIVRSRSALSNGSIGGRASPFSTLTQGLSSTQGRKSPLGSSDRGSPMIDQVVNSSPRRNHDKEPSVASSSSGGGIVESSPLTTASFAPSSRSANSRTSNRPVVYRDNFGLDTLMTFVDADSTPRKPKRKPQVGIDELFGSDLNDLDLHPEVRAHYEETHKAYSSIERELDALLLKVMRKN